MAGAKLRLNPDHLSFCAADLSSPRSVFVKDAVTPAEVEAGA